MVRFRIFWTSTPSPGLSTGHPLPGGEGRASSAGGDFFFHDVLEFAGFFDVGVGAFEALAGEGLVEDDAYFVDQAFDVAAAHDLAADFDELPVKGDQGNQGAAAGVDETAMK